MKFNLENLREIKNLVRELSVGLRRLTIRNNFEGFEVDTVIPAASNVTIRNQLDFVPTRYIILSQTGNGLITKATTPWSTNYIYFTNNGAAQVEAKIFIMR